MKDYYKILEVNKEASPEIIAKVYKILAKKYHPDLQDDINRSEAEEKFKEVAEAYEILSNEEKRKEYDQQLETMQQENSIDKNDYESLRNYCIQLENELNQLKSIYYSDNQYNENSYFSSENSQRVEQQTQQQSYHQAQQEAYNDAVNKAYHDAYVNNLRNMGYKIKYKKTFKETCKNLLSLLITAIIIFIIIKIIWAIPSLRDSIISLFVI